MKSKIVLVHLRRPSRGDPRNDPFWEFGSFGCTGCHTSNLLSPVNAPNLRNKRLGFIQGGDRGLRLVFLSPPVKRVRFYATTGRSEVRWSPVLRPLKYEKAPLLVDEAGRTDGFFKLREYIQSAQPESWKQKLSFKFRSRISALEDDLATEMELKYEQRRRQIGEKGLASYYWEALPVSSRLHKAINRKARYQFVRTEANGGEKGETSCPPCSSSGRSKIPRKIGESGRCNSGS